MASTATSSAGQRHIHANNLQTLQSSDRLCAAFGIKITTDITIISIAKTAGYDCLFIDLEHTTLSLRDASQLCIAGLNAGITPFVRVPYQCGRGLVQRVLDMGAMGVIFPHISGVKDAREAVSMCRFPPTGGRSLALGMPHFAFKSVDAQTCMRELDAHGSTVFIMIETKSAFEAVEDIAAQEGVDALLVGSNDLGQELGCLGEWDGDVFMGALQRVGEACKKNGKVFAVAGLYHRPDLMKRVVNEFGARWVLSGLDAGLLQAATKNNCEGVKALQEP